MDIGFRLEHPLTGASFGGRIHVEGAAGALAVIEAAEANPTALTQALARSHGVMVISGMGAIAENPALLVRLSRLFGPEVENYHTTHMAANMVHPEVPEIFVVSNIPPVFRAPPPKPTPPLTPEGKLPVQFPHRRGWHTDQSYHRPPPDISLFLAVQPVPQGQGQTLFADGIAAYEALPAETKARIATLQGLHIASAAGRKYDAVKSGAPQRELAPHERPVRQPLVRTHPVTGQKSLYLCEYGQMDWLEGPIEGLEPGPDGEGGRLLVELAAHYTDPRFVYVHEWTQGDLVVWDNRCTLHAATWFDAEHLARVMWRTTVWGNPGPAYAGEVKSWLPDMEG